MSDLEQELLTAIQVLNGSVWRNRVDGATIEQWLREFGDEALPGTWGRLHALYLLSRFIYFGDDEVRGLIRALYRDHLRYPIVANARRMAQDTRDEKELQTTFDATLQRTRFLGIGNPSESGTHLLYHYRQENNLPRKLFISPDRIFDLKKSSPTLADATIERYVFIDDFCGSGTQAVRYSAELVGPLLDAAGTAGVSPVVSYHVLVGTNNGLQRIRDKTKFANVECVLELDETFRAFDVCSRYFRSPPAGIELKLAHQLAQAFGEQLHPAAPLGFADSQLMLGFVHNTPNNSLPIFWHGGSATKTWHPVFRRYAKLSFREVRRAHAGD